MIKSIQLKKDLRSGKIFKICLTLTLQIWRKKSWIFNHENIQIKHTFFNFYHFAKRINHRITNVTSQISKISHFALKSENWEFRRTRSLARNLLLQLAGASRRRRRSHACARSSVSKCKQIRSRKIFPVRKNGGWKSFSRGLSWSKL